MAAVTVDPRRLRMDALERLRDSPRPKSAIELAAIERQFQDLKKGHERGLVWDEAEVQRNLRMIRQLKHWKGRHRGMTFEPEEWQEQLVFAPLFGWYRDKPRNKAGLRRFGTSYLEIPRKNGKTFMASALATQGLIWDREYGAEVYATATKKDQAEILFQDVVNTTKGTELEKFIRYQRYILQCEKLRSRFRALASDSHSLDGLNPSRGIADELHEHKTRNLWDVINEGMAARDNPLMIGITTAGVDRSSICWEQHTQIGDILLRGIAEDSVHGLICCADVNDDIEDPGTWWKANPNLGISVKRDFLEKEARQAARSPSKENNFRRKHLNQWTQQDVRWIVMKDWDACKHDFDDNKLIAMECYVGLDLASTKDVVAMSLVWPQEDGGYIVRCNYWVPRDAAHERAKSDRREVMNWVNQGLIHATEGNATDYMALERELNRVFETYDVRGLAFDPYNAEACLQHAIAQGVPERLVYKFPNRMSNMAGPSQEFERLILHRKLRHNGDPVLRWMASNVTTKDDPGGNKMPDKSKSSEKIDGIVATIMAIGLATQQQNKNQPGGFAFYGT